MLGPKAAVLVSVLLLALCSCSSATGGVTTTTPTQSVKENSTVRFTCTIPSNYNNPVVKWRFTDKEGSVKLIYFEQKVTDPYKDRVTYSGAGLVFSSVTRKDTGEYTCDVLDKDQGLYGEAKMELIVEVPPSTPVLRVPASVTAGGVAELQCIETDGSPPPTIKWYKDKTLMPVNPKDSLMFRNSSYTMDDKTGVLRFSSVTKDDVGQYSCEASNSLGRAASTSSTMEVYSSNVGGIVAAVVIVTLILAVIGIGLWFAYSRGYIGKQSKTGKKVIYSTPSETKSDRNFQQTSSFLV